MDSIRVQHLQNQGTDCNIMRHYEAGGRKFCCGQSASAGVGNLCCSRRPLCIARTFSLLLFHGIGRTPVHRAWLWGKRRLGPKQVPSHVGCTTSHWLPFDAVSLSQHCRRCLIAPPSCRATVVPLDSRYSRRHRGWRGRCQTAESSPLVACASRGITAVWHS